MIRFDPPVTLRLRSLPHHIRPLRPPCRNPCFAALTRQTVITSARRNLQKKITRKFLSPCGAECSKQVHKKKLRRKASRNPQTSYNIGRIGGLCVGSSLTGPPLSRTLATTRNGSFLLIRRRQITTKPGGLPQVHSRCAQPTPWQRAFRTRCRPPAPGVPGPPPPQDARCGERLPRRPRGRNPGVDRKPETRVSPTSP